MAQINLLQQNSKNSLSSINYARLAVRILLVAVVALILWYGWVFLKTKSASRNITITENKISSTKIAIAGNKQRDELLTRQSQLKELDNLIQSHVYWSNILPALAEATLKTVTFTRFNLLLDGHATITGKANSIADLDKFLQVFDQPQFYKNFSDIRISGLTKSQEGEVLTVKFDIGLKYNKALLQYKTPSAANAQ